MTHSLTLYHDYEPDGTIRPVWLGVNFSEPIQWDKKILYIDIDDYKTCDIHDFEDGVMGCSIYLEDLSATIRENRLGINLNNVRERVIDEGMDCYDIKRFILLVTDVVEVVNSSL